MTDELKACPFCGNTKDIVGEWSEPDDDGDQYYTTTCPMCNAQTNDWYTWQTRPLEDALLARAECADADANRLSKLLIQQQNRVKQAEAIVERLIEAGNETVNLLEQRWNGEGGTGIPQAINNFTALVAEWQARNG